MAARMRPEARAKLRGAREVRAAPARADVKRRKLTDSLVSRARLDPTIAERGPAFIPWLREVLTEARRRKLETDDLDPFFSAARIWPTSEEVSRARRSRPARRRAANQADYYGDTVEQATPKVVQLSKEVRDDKDAMVEAAAATREMETAVRDLLGQLNAEDAFANFQIKMWNYRSLGVNASEQDTRDYIRSLADMVVGLEGVPDETKARMIAYLEDGDIATVEGYLQEWGKGVTVPVRFTGQGKVGFMKDEFATGTDFAPGGRVLVGERGPEIVDLPHGSTVYPAHESRVMQMAGQPGIGASSDQTAGITSTFHLNVNAPIYGVTDLERTVQRAIDQHDRLLVQSLRAGQRR